jgi:predicted enzyme related to lactoylglutathione lyase
MKFVHQELHTTDPAKAKAFYRALFGWTFQDMDMPEGPYTMINTAEGSLGGMMAAQDGMPPTWIGYIDVDSVERLVARAIEAGAKVLVPKTDVGGFGYMAWLQDPQGATFAVWQSTSPAQSEPSAGKKASKKASKKSAAAPAAAAPEKASKKAAKKAGKKASKAAAAPAAAPAPAKKKTAKKSAAAPAAAPAPAKKKAAKKSAAPAAPAKAAAKAPAAKKAAKAQPAAPKAAPAGKKTGKKKSGKG